jgi:hypothetical protein
VSISGHETFSSYGFLEKDININLLLDCLGRKRQRLLRGFAEQVMKNGDNFWNWLGRAV